MSEATTAISTAAPAAAEEREVGGQLDPVVLLVEQGRGEADDDAAQHAVVDQLLRRCPQRLGDRVQHERVVVARCGGVDRGAVRGRDHAVCRDGVRLAQDVRRQGGGDPAEHEVADERREAGGAVRLAGVADRDAEREQQGQVAEQRVAGRGQHVGHRQQPVGAGPQAVGAEHVGLAQPQQQRGGGERGDREHEGSTHALQLRESGDAPLRGIDRGGGHGHSSGVGSRGAPDGAAHGSGGGVGTRCASVRDVRGRRRAGKLSGPVAVRVV
jgi:hypothetical protein